jgi:RimJ/RimL family protein N-acetyltransferase
MLIERERRMETPRLVLRRWREEDLPGYARLGADERVMEWIGGTWTRDQSDAAGVEVMKEPG